MIHALRGSERLEVVLLYPKIIFSGVRIRRFCIIILHDGLLCSKLDDATIIAPLPSTLRTLQHGPSNKKHYRYTYKSVFL